MSTLLQSALDKADFLKQCMADDGYWLLESHEMVVELAAEVRRLQADERRLDWLIRSDRGTFGRYMLMEVARLDANDELTLKIEYVGRAAIDAAMEAGK